MPYLSFDRFFVLLTLAKNFSDNSQDLVLLFGAESLTHVLDDRVEQNVVERSDIDNGQDLAFGEIV